MCCEDFTAYLECSVGPSPSGLSLSREIEVLGMLRTAIGGVVSSKQSGRKEQGLSEARKNQTHVMANDVLHKHIRGAWPAVKKMT